MSSIDIVVPCYQYGRYLKTCVTSILSQDWQDFRILIIDNASTDDSVAIARELARQDKRINVIAQPVNLGPHASYNEGIAWASSDYLLILDADDLLAPGALKRGVEFLESHPGVGFCHGRELRSYFDADARPILSDKALQSDFELIRGKDFIRSQSKRAICYVGASTVIRRTSIQKQAGNYNTELKFTDDWEMWFRLALLGDVASTNAVQAIRRLHPATQSTIYKGNPTRDFVEREATFVSFFNGDGKKLDDRDRLLKQAQSDLASQAYWSGVSHLVRKDIRNGVSLLKYAFARKPSAFLIPPLTHLTKMKSPLRRVADVVLETITRQPRGHWLTGQDDVLIGFTKQNTDVTSTNTALPSLLYTKPSVCVIIAACNAEATISQAVASALNQDHVTEVIVIDDCSSDRTADAVRQVDDYTERLRIIRLETNRGPAAARNIALQHAKADYFCVLDADDYFLPGRIASLFKSASISDWELIADDIMIVNENQKGRDVLARKHDRINISTISIDAKSFIEKNISQSKLHRRELGFLKPIIKREFFNKHHLKYDENLRLGEDYALYLEALLHQGRFLLASFCGYVAIERENSLSAEHSIHDLKQLADFDRRLIERKAVADPQTLRALKRHYRSIRIKYLHREIIEHKQRHGLVKALTMTARNPSAVTTVFGEAFASRIKPATSFKAKSSVYSHSPRFLIGND